MKVLQIIYLIILTTFMVNAQNSSKPKKAGPFAQFTIAREGWTTLPFINEISKIENSKSEYIGIVEVTKKSFSFKNTLLTYHESCDAEYDAKQIAKGNKRYFRGLGAESYVFEDKIFAYIIYASYAAVKNGYILNVPGVGAYVRFTYIDKDGDGTFELSCNVDEDLKSVPRWVGGKLVDPPPPLKIKKNP